MKTLLVSLVLVASSFLLLAPAVSVGATDVLAPDACAQAPSAAVCQDKSSSAENPLANSSGTGIINKVTLIIAVVAGIVAIILIIISGLRFITSGGEAQKVAGARNNLLYAIVGLVVIALASGIFSFVVSKL